ncbi:MAG: tRNA-dihydrouridine synthase family protein [Candidatus Omnitrophica bacterium]|nr:tRNA-dihydrouridine synthase family protein [Candidatus Omnitrophota bacterium]
MNTILYMAPIMGVTGCIYRNVYSRFFTGYDKAVTPFIGNTKGRRSSLKDVLPENNRAGFALVPQILDDQPANFIKLAKKLYDMGYGTVNWNLGCPMRMIRNKRRGSGMLPYHADIVSFLDKTISVIPNRVSLKVRLGSEERSDLAVLLPQLDRFDLEEIIVHPRTGVEMYSGKADISAFEECLSLSKHAFVYNGDIDSLEKYQTLSERLPSITRWMIGRGGITNPFLPEEIKAQKSVPLHEKEKRFKSFHDALLEEYQKTLSGPSHLIGKMKEAWEYWSGAMKDGETLFLEISRAKSLKQYHAAISASRMIS